MTLKELITLAIQKSPHFGKKWNHWTVIREKQPTLEWLMPLLEEALGEDFVQKAAQEHLEAQALKKN